MIFIVFFFLRLRRDVRRIWWFPLGMAFSSPRQEQSGRAAQAFKVSFSQQFNETNSILYTLVSFFKKYILHAYVLTEINMLSLLKIYI